MILRAKRICWCQNILNISSNFLRFFQTVSARYSRCSTLWPRSCLRAALGQSCPLHTSSLIAQYRKVRCPCFEALWLYWTQELLVPVEKFTARMPMTGLGLATSRLWTECSSHWAKQLKTYCWEGVAFSSEKYNGSTGHINSWYQ